MNIHPLNWFRQLREHGRIDPADYDKLEVTYSSVEEARTMLITALEKEREQLREEGRREGVEQGIEQGKKSERIEMLMMLLERRFDTVPNEVGDSLNKCSLDQLDALINPAFDSSDLDAFLAHLPEHEPTDGNEQDSFQDSNSDAAD